MKTKSIILVTLLSCVFLIGCNEENEPAMKSETLLGDVVGYENEPDIDNDGNEPKTDDCVITATVENASKYSNVVHVKFSTFDYFDYREVELAHSEWKDGSFVIELPETVNPSYLHPLISGDWMQDLYDLHGRDPYYNGPTTIIHLNHQPNVKISNPNVKIANACFRGFDENNHIVATDFFYEKVIDENNYTRAVFTYADSDVTIYGNHATNTIFPGGNYIEIINIYSVELKKGWNVWYRSMSYTKENDNIVITEQWSSTPVCKLKWYGYIILLM